MLNHNPEIQIRGLTLPAVVCDDCGARIWPGTELDRHTEAHKAWREKAYGNNSPAKNRPHKTGPRTTPLKRESEKDRPRGINIGTRSAGARL